MTAPKPYRATPDELRAIDAGLLDMGGPPISDEKLLEFFGAEAARLRSKANAAETVEMRTTILGDAERLDKLAATISASWPEASTRWR